jgi:hypothetical protein
MNFSTRKGSALLFLCASFFLPGDRAWAQQAGQPVNMGGGMQGRQMGAAPRGRLRKLNLTTLGYS